MFEDNQSNNVVEMAKPKRRAYATWTVAGVEYKLKLTTAAICELEQKLKGNLLNALTGESLPPLNIALGITHGALHKFHHGISYDGVKELFDTYCDEGGSQIAFLTDVLVPVYEASGFFTDKQSAQVEQGLTKAKEQL